MTQDEKTVSDEGPVQRDFLANYAFRTFRKDHEEWFPYANLSTILRDIADVGEEDITKAMDLWL